ncbi:3-isopropylmalate dehydrogenase [Candidatus Woesearchaeota archaeon]|nr:3-isopropylmalate dehydrogenase [Candidatus Woesearchaeota archaeon]
MAAYNIAVLPGDGIGPEITREAIKVLDAVGRKFSLTFSYRFADFGGIAFDRHGHPFPDATKSICDAADAIMKGPIGGPKYDTLPDVMMRPEAGALLPLRRRYDTFANLRPVVLQRSIQDASPLKPERLGKGVDILMIRELVGGIYFGRKVEPAEQARDEKGEWYALDECRYTESQVKRIARVAFRQARQRNSPLHNIHKANVLATSRFWNLIVQDVQKTEFPGVEMRNMLVDSAATALVTNPSQFGVMLLENMQGDILTDEGGGILGSLGLMPSACLNPETGRGYYEPAHGSAPDIAGQNTANPYSQIGSAAMMLAIRFGLQREADAVWAAMLKVFGDGYRTGEIKTPNTPLEKIVSTSQFGDLVAENVSRVEVGR